MIFGSPPTLFTALRIAARSTTNGTPVKSCKTMRATTNGISSFAGFFAFQLASVSTSLRRTFLPSQLRNTDSSTIRMLTGSREIFPIPCSSSAGSEYRKPSRPFPASNFLSVLKSSFIFEPRRTRSSRRRTNVKTFVLFVSFVVNRKSFQLRQFRFDFIEVRQLAGVVAAFGVLNDSILVDDERG